MQEVVYVNPKEEDLIIPGELLSVSVKFSSFIVEFQLHSDLMSEGQFKVYKRIYPVKFIKEFFKVNGTLENHNFCVRPNSFQWAD